MNRSSSTLLFYAVFTTLTLLAAAPFWLTHILPLQDYPHFLLFARALGDHRDPSSPFHGTYTTGFPLSPLLLPLLITRAIGAVTSLEDAGRVVWTLYAVSLPTASLYLLHVLRRDRWCVLLVFPLILSYWVIGGFLPFATATPLLLLGLACAVRWLEASSWRRGAALAAVASALFLWHALMWAQLLLDFGLLWLLWRADSARDRLRALSPVLPSLALYVAWMLTTVRGQPPGKVPPVWSPVLAEVTHFFEYIGPILPGSAGCVLLLSLLLAAGSLATPAPPTPAWSFRVRSPFGWLSLVAALCYALFPQDCFGVEGINNRQPFIAALLFVFGWNLPARRLPRAALLGAVGAAGAVVLSHLCGRFLYFDRESIGASHLIDSLGPGSTLLAPLGDGSTRSFPGRPLVAAGLYASVRHGGLPNSSFAGYNINFIHYVNNTNPMPGIDSNWINHPDLTRFDYVLLRWPGPEVTSRPTTLKLTAKEGGWSLFAVCGSRVLPECELPAATEKP